MVIKKWEFKRTHDAINLEQIKVTLTVALNEISKWSLKQFKASNCAPLKDPPFLLISLSVSHSQTPPPSKYDPSLCYVV